MTNGPSKSTRHRAREKALQILYQLDLNSDLTPEAGMYHFERCFSRGEEIDPFTQRLVSGVTKNLATLDATIASVSEHWRLDRMPAVDRNLLRIGAFELEHCDDIPATISIDEMIELAKAFGSENSPAFVNAILDKIKANLNRPSKAP